MRVFSLLLLLLFGTCAPSHGGTVYCTNCSDRFMQAVEKATSLEQLKTLVKEYDEAIRQTAAQLQMAQQNIEQNTVALPKEVIRKIASEMSKFGQITGALTTMRNDVVGLGKVFDELYSAQSELKDLARMPRNMLQGGMTTYHTSWDNWSRRVDDSTKATFQLSGKQLKDLEESGELETYINELLSTPDGQQKALMAGNQLAALQIQEARQLLATKIQSDLASQDKAEKESQMGQELHRYMLEGFGKIGTTSRPDPF